jgi:hypothetical protein
MASQDKNSDIVLHASRSSKENWIIEYSNHGERTVQTSPAGKQPLELLIFNSAVGFAPVQLIHHFCEKLGLK